MNKKLIFWLICIFMIVGLNVQIVSSLDVGLGSSDIGVVLEIPETPINYSIIATVNSSDYWDNWNIIEEALSSDSSLIDKIMFKLNEFIDNLVDGWIRITGSLNVTEFSHFNKNATFKKDVIIDGKLFGGASPLQIPAGIDLMNSSISGGYTGFPIPNYDSDWVTILMGQTIVNNHNLSGNMDNYFIDLTFKHIDLSRHIIGLGGFDNYYGTPVVGAWWHNLTNTNISVTKGDVDTSVDKFRVRIWRY